MMHGQKNIKLKVALNIKELALWSRINEAFEINVF